MLAVSMASQKDYIMRGLIRLLGAIILSSQAFVGNAAEVKVLASGGFRTAYLALLPGF